VGLEVQTVDANSGEIYTTATDVVTVTTPPTFFDKYKWDGLGILALIILLILAALWRRRVIRDRKNVRGLVAMLRLGGVPAGQELAAEEKYSEVFEFIIRDESSPAPRLDHPPRGATMGVYQLRRGTRGMVRLTAPAGLRPYEIEVGGPGQTLASGLELAFRDTRHPDWAPSADPSAYGQTQEYSVSPGYSPASTGDWTGTSASAGDWAGSSAESPATPTWSPSGPPPSPTNEPGSMPTMPVAPPVPPKDPWL